MSLAHAEPVSNSQTANYYVQQTLKELRQERILKAAEDWQADREACYKELYESKTPSQKKLMAIRTFGFALEDFADFYLNELRLEFISLRAGKRLDGFIEKIL